MSDDTLKSYLTLASERLAGTPPTCVKEKPRVPVKGEAESTLPKGEAESTLPKGEAESTLLREKPNTFAQEGSRT